MKAIREFGKFIPAFAAFEKNRLSLYREAAKEAEEIFDRWADEIDDLDEDFMEDEDYEPDEYYSDAIEMLSGFQPTFQWKHKSKNRSWYTILQA